MLVPESLAVFLAIAFAVAISVPGWAKAARRAGRFCESCGRRVVLGEKTCDCDD